MKGHPLKVALKLFKEGYRGHVVDIYGGNLAYLAWRAEGDHHWITHEQYKLLMNLQCSDTKSNTTI